MRKFWLVFAYEYWRQVNQKWFFLALLSLPLLGVAFGLILLIGAYLEYDPSPVGYVDRSGLLKNVAVEIEPNNEGLANRIQVLAYVEEKDARQALETDQIQVYYVLAEDYLTTGEVQMVAKKPPSVFAERRFSQFLRESLVANYPVQVRKRLFSPYKLVIHSPEEQSVQERNYLWVQSVFPFVGGIMLVLAITTSGGYLLQHLAEERKNRMLEILVTSVPPQSLMMGKVLANMCVGLTQLFIWMSYPLAAVLIALTVTPSITSSDLLGLPVWLSVVLMFFTFIMVSALMGMIASVMEDEKYTQLISSLFLLVVMFPMYVWGTVVNYPNWWLVTIMSLVPLTSAIMMPLRVALTDVQSWQIVLSVGLSITGAVGSLVLVGYVFRWWMLRYGKPLKLYEFLRRG